MKNESKFYHEIKKNINQISWIRIENSVIHGVADLLGYNDNCTFFTVELKVARGNKVTFSPHQIAYHYKHPKNNFICVKGQDPRSPKLFEGSKVRDPWPKDPKPKSKIKRTKTPIPLFSRKGS